MAVSGATFGIVGGLAAFPRRLAAREVTRMHGRLRRGIARQTTHAVFGRMLLDRRDEMAIEAAFDRAVAAGATPLSETSFLRMLGVSPVPPNASIARNSLLDQSGLTSRGLDLLALFDAFEHQREPFSFRDVILAKKYAGLLAGGAGWSAIARSIHRSGPVTSLTALSLHASTPKTIHARHGEALAELDGQRLLPLDEPDEAAADEYFEAAESAEAAKQFADAALLYERCLAIDPGDSVAAFNRANCLKADGRIEEAAHSFAVAIKRDPAFVEAWFNFAILLRERGQPAAARQHLDHAIATDPTYADAIYNLATIDYDAGDLTAARTRWARYLELDTTDSKWSKLAARGILYADQHLQKSAG
jgi:tetratricopeptide (TPR) repeat protein